MAQNKHILICILMTGVFGILNTEMGVIGILPHIAERYGVSIVHAGLLISLFAFGVAIAGPTMPLLCSRFNRKHIMLLVLGLFTLCNAVSVFAEDFEVLLVARVLPSFFHPVYCSMAFTVAADLAGPKDAPRAVALINIGVAAGMVIGVPVSNYLAEILSLQASMSFFAVVTCLSLLATACFVPSLPVQKRLSYGTQLSVLRKPIVWVSIIAVIFLNGSIYGVFNYMAGYLASVTGLAPALVSILLFAYGACNIVGSILAGHLLAEKPAATVMAFPPILAGVYMLLFTGGENWPAVVILLIFWGLLGGINANINQFWIFHAAPESPDFANGLFLTAANIGCMVGTAFCGVFIDTWGMAFVVCGGLVFITAAGFLFLWQCCVRSINPVVHAVSVNV